MELSIEKAKEVMKEIIQKSDGYKDSWLLLGAAGVGKTMGIQQLAKELAVAYNLKFVEYDDSKLEEILANPEQYFVLVDFSLVTTEPSDLQGIPRDADSCVKYKPFGWHMVLQRCRGMLFLDEITNVQRPDVQSVMLKLLLEKKSGFVKLRDDVIVVGAGNRPEHSSIAGELPSPVMGGRVIRIDIGVPDIVEWIRFMDEHCNEDWDRRIAVFLKRFPEFYLEEAPEKGLESFGTPRSWTKLAKMSHKLSKSALEAIVDGIVGKNAAKMLMSFLSVDVPPLERVTTHNWRTLDLTQKYFLLLEMAGREDLRKDLLEFMVDNDVESLVLWSALMKKDLKKKVIPKLRRESEKVFKKLLEVAVDTVKFSADW